MSKTCLVLLLSSVLLFLTGCVEEQANLGEQLLLSGQQSQADFWHEYPENWDTDVYRPKMLAKNAK